MVPEKWSPGKMVLGKIFPEKNGRREEWSPKNWSPEQWSPENWSPEKCTPGIVLRQNNARKFKRFFHFDQLIPLHTKKMFDVHVTILHMHQTVEH